MPKISRLLITKLGGKLLLYLQIYVRLSPQEMHKIHDPKEILNTYISMKKYLEKCVNFDPSVDEFWQ